LIEARDEKLLGRVIKRYAAYGLLICDELGYVPFSKEGSDLLFQVFVERHEGKSVIITTNLGFGVDPRYLAIQRSQGPYWIELHIKHILSTATGRVIA